MSNNSSGTAIDLLEEKIEGLTSGEAIKLLDEEIRKLKAKLGEHSFNKKVSKLNHNLRKRAKEDYEVDFNKINNVIEWAEDKIKELKGNTPVGGRRNRKTRRNRRNKKRNTRKFK